MERCDVLVVGGGPAGSTVAWKLTQAGLDVRVLDKAWFPREKLCAGWITPPVIDALELETADYGQGRVLQPITGFRVGLMGRGLDETTYGAVVSYAIRRSEFDQFLLERSGARVRAGTPVARLERVGGGWVVNDEIRVPLLVGAGGHFCPVARAINPGRRNEPAVVTQEVEVPLADAPVGVADGQLPEFYFCRDLKGYGWCFRKERFLNVGIGRLDPRRFPSHVRAFMDLLRSQGKLPFEVPDTWRGHAYLLWGSSSRRLLDDQVLLVGDAAGLAYPQSGEGIRTAVESGLLAARTIVEADGRYDRDRLEAYRDRLRQRLGHPGGWARVSRRLPESLKCRAAPLLFASRWFRQRVVLDQWFLHREQGPLANLPE